jgi:hypothetical protein
MNRRRLRFSQALGTLLPLCLLWAFIGCVSLCLQHGEDAHPDDAAEMLLSDCSADGCPMIDDTKFIAPGRQQNLSQPDARQDSCPASAPALRGIYAFAPPCEFDAPPLPTSGAPPDSICILRI